MYNSDNNDLLRIVFRCRRYVLVITTLQSCTTRVIRVALYTVRSTLTISMTVYHFEWKKSFTIPSTRYYCEKTLQKTICIVYGTNKKKKK